MRELSHRRQSPAKTTATATAKQSTTEAQAKSNADGSEADILESEETNKASIQPIASERSQRRYKSNTLRNKYVSHVLM